MSRRTKVICAVVSAVVAISALRVVLLYRGIDDGMAHWKEPRGEPGGLLYVALGDSAAQGLGASEWDKGYVGLIAQRLRDKTGKPVQVINLSKSGATVRDVLQDQVPRMAALSRLPDLVTVGAGGNDVRNFDRTRFTKDARELVALLPPTAYVADGPHFIHKWWTANADAAADVMAQELRAQNRPVVPLHAEMRKQGRRALVTQFAADVFHPNDRGYRVWAQAFWSRIEPDLR
jgi:acyl-CoA thioesterase-1